MVDRQVTFPSLASRAEEDHRHNGAILEYLPFSRVVFEHIIRTLPLHGDTARTINRSDQAMFAEIDLRGTEWDSLCKSSQFSPHPPKNN